ncbi:MAG: EamA family transporter [Candidatus Diapherotrites archaeon]|nr:EamA family transporter [Candidatus Diapherotrites archaeon]
MQTNDLEAQNVWKWKILAHKEYKRKIPEYTVPVETYGLASIITSAVLASIGQILYKIGVDGNSWTAILAALGIYGISTIFYIYGLKTVPLSVAYPMISISYIIVTIAAAQMFGEAITASKIIGILLIMAGITLIVR